MGGGGYKKEIHRKDDEITFTLSKFVKVMPSGENKFEWYRIRYDLSNNRLIDNIRLISLERDASRIYVPISGVSCEYDKATEIGLPNSIVITKYDLTKKLMSNLYSIDKVVELSPVAERWEYQISKVQSVPSDGPIANKYALKKGDSVLDVPLGNVGYKIE